MNVFMYDNNTGTELPTKVGTYDVKIILANTLQDVLNSVEKNAKLFVVFTTIKDADISVATENEANALREQLNFSNINANVVVRDSMWYSPVANSTVVISGSLDIDKEKLSVLLKNYISSMQEFIPKDKLESPVELYRIINTRNTKEVWRTTNLYNAKDYCDRHPCTVIVRRNNTIVYRSNGGKISTDPAGIGHMQRLHDSHLTNSATPWNIR